MGPDFSGAVVSVLDGDTIEVRTTNTLNVSASRSPNDTQKNGATRSIVRRGRRTFWRAINWDCSPQNQTRYPTEHGELEGNDNHRFHDNLLS
jgi:endonuclease YncB( thermonuclease family)